MQQYLKRLFSVSSYKEEKKLLIRHLEEALTEAERLKEENKTIKRSGCRSCKRLFHKMLEDKEGAALERKKDGRNGQRSLSIQQSSLNNRKRSLSYSYRESIESQKEELFNQHQGVAIIRRLENEKNLTIHQLSEELRIDRHSIRQWIQQKEQILKQVLLNSTRADRFPEGERKILDSEIERETILQIHNQRSEGNQITEKRLFTHFRLKQQNMGLVFSEGQLRSFMERYHLSFKFKNARNICEQGTKFLRMYNVGQTSWVQKVTKSGTHIISKHGRNWSYARYCDQKDNQHHRSKDHQFHPHMIQCRAKQSLRWCQAFSLYNLPFQSCQREKGKRIQKKLKTITSSLGFSKSGIMNREMCLEWLNTTWQSNIEDPKKCFLLQIIMLHIA